MADEKKLTEEEQKTVESNSEQDKPKPTEEKTEEKTDEEPKTEDKFSKESQEPTAEEPALPEMTKEQELEAENFRLKTQLEAMKIGFSPEVIEDAVVLAENIVKCDGVDIAEALKTVSKKYPDWKVDTGREKGGFKIGADSTGTKPTSADDKLKKAFGIKKG